MQMRQVIKFLLGVLIFFQLTGMSKGEKTCNRAIANYAKKMEKEGFILTAEGGGESKEPETWGLQKTIMLSFETNECLDIVKGRKLVVFIANDFLNYINSFESLKPYLLNVPFAVNNIRIMVSNRNISYISTANLCKGKIYYYANDIKAPNFGLVYEETFDEAMRLVNEPASAQ